MADQLTIEQRTQFTDVFHEFDAAKAGKIPVKDLGPLMASLGHSTTEAELKVLVREADVDFDGFVELDEFLNLMIHRIQDRVISPEELRQIANVLGDRLTDDEIAAMIHEVGDGSGNIDYQVLLKMFLQQG
eukprot:TRINITY_DN58140_c0_g1_i1.p2 TRINITY_DN58140_c0_g1~~TRINITY_DN58140_c0_g1_i1.p2  ORF type:complete len:131 (-),score=29.94 TRINITY_DN58140_c0_g1_i1:65-457(-)